MQLAVHADSPVNDFSPNPSPSTRLSTKFMVAGVAMASAGVIAVSPVAPPMPNIQDVQERVAHAAVQLTAATNPLVVWQQAIANTVASLQTLTEGSIEANTNLFEALSTGYIFREIANVAVLNTLNPGPLLTELANFQTRFGTRISERLNLAFTGLTETVAELPAVLQEAGYYLSQGQFVEAFSKINGWFVFGVLQSALNPLINVINIPGEFVALLPGVAKLDNLINVVSERNVAKSIFEPIIGAILQSAEILDATRAAAAAGDFGTAVNELVNLPVRVANALLNGITPAGTTTQWQGLIRGGFGTYLMVTLPNLIAAAVTAPPAPPAGPASASFGGGETFALNITDPEGGGEPAGGIVDEEGDTPDADANAEAEAAAAAAAAAEAEAAAAAEAEAEAAAAAAAEAEAAAKAEAAEAQAAADAAAAAEAEANKPEDQQEDKPADGGDES